jgi:hypothetical protein
MKSEIYHIDAVIKATDLKVKAGNGELEQILFFVIV